MRVRLKSENAALKKTISNLKEEIRIKDARMHKISAKKRPNYSPTDRLAILELKAVNNWSKKQTAKIFLLESPFTITNWLKSLNEKGKQSLTKLHEPVNKFPDFVKHIVRRLKVLCPYMGKVKIAQTLARAGLHLSVTTVGRFLQTKKPKQPAMVLKPSKSASEASQQRKINAKYPDHIWNFDMTLIPTSLGFWIPWIPYSLSQIWPFCWWVCAAIDRYSRTVTGVRLYHRQPTSRQISSFLSRIIRKTGQKPKHTISDQGSQFQCTTFKNWCRKNHIKHRYGAVQKYGSIAIIERFFKTLKQDFTRRITIPFRKAEMNKHLSCFKEWYNIYRPHQGIAGLTPCEKSSGFSPACQLPRYEPRMRFPVVYENIRGSPGVRLELSVDFYKEYRTMPIVKLKQAA
jgi:transposase InsO family protein